MGYHSKFGWVEQYEQDTHEYTFGAHHVLVKNLATGETNRYDSMMRKRWEWKVLVDMNVLMCYAFRYQKCSLQAFNGWTPVTCNWPHTQLGINALVGQIKMLRDRAYEDVLGMLKEHVPRQLRAQLLDAYESYLASYSIIKSIYDGFKSTGIRLFANRQPTGMYDVSELWEPPPEQKLLDAIHDAAKELMVETLYRIMNTPSARIQNGQSDDLLHWMQVLALLI